MALQRLLLPALVLGAALAGCDRPDDGRSVGQKVDGAIAATERKADEAGAAIKRESAEAADKARQAANEAKPEVQDAARDAKQAVKEAGAKLADATSDARITAEVKSQLGADPQLSAMRIDVDTHDGVVTLKGPAPDEATRSRATQLAAAPKGVMRVENHLTVNGASS
jgi:hyperosmotically inducible periplasmic protein